MQGRLAQLLPPRYCPQNFYPNPPQSACSACPLSPQILFNEEQQCIFFVGQKNPPDYQGKYFIQKRV
ncbi:MAG: hypothetical protein JWP81_362 [Ferruginibacter sp.]|nr:hypothetical protein [Ferruginibacter sp.]